VAPPNGVIPEVCLLAGLVYGTRLVSPRGGGPCLVGARVQSNVRFGSKGSDSSTQRLWLQDAPPALVGG